MQKGSGGSVVGFDQTQAFRMTGEKVVGTPAVWRPQLVPSLDKIGELHHLVVHRSDGLIWRHLDTLTSVKEKTDNNSSCCTNVDHMHSLNRFLYRVSCTGMFGHTFSFQIFSLI